MQDAQVYRSRARTWSRIAGWLSLAIVLAFWLFCVGLFGLASAGVSTYTLPIVIGFAFALLPLAFILGLVAAYHSRLWLLSSLAAALTDGAILSLFYSLKGLH